MKIKRVKKSYEEAADSFQESATTPPKKEPIEQYKNFISTGSTQLDLAISGDIVRGGGVPGGIIIELSGEWGLGKTALASEMCGFGQSDGGEIRFIDPESRLNQAYLETYGVALPKDHYKRLHLVNEVFDDILSWDPINKNALNIYVCDSIAALSTKLEMEKGDKMGMRRAKELSEGLRKTSVSIAEGHKLIILTNQIRTGDKGKFTPGGNAVKHYASVRIELNPFSQFVKGYVNKKKDIAEEITMGGRRVSQSIGIRSIATVAKNSLASPKRTAPISIIYNYGVDDIRENLQYVKDMKGQASFIAPDSKTFVGLRDAAIYVEEKKLEFDLKEQVIDIWEEIQRKFKAKEARPRKRRIPFRG